MSWNVKNAPVPPEITVIFNRTDLGQASAVTHSQISSISQNVPKICMPPEQWLQNLTTILQTTKITLKSNEVLMKTESSTLFAVTFQNMRHKNEKYMQILKKVMKCFKHWEEIRLAALISNVLDMIPKEYYQIQKIRLPSTRSFFFVMQRMVGSFKLLLQAASYCIQAAIYLRSKMLTGHCFSFTTIAFSLIARLRIFAIDLANIISDAYDQLHPYIQGILKVHPVKDDQSLPTSLIKEFNAFNNQIIKLSVDERIEAAKGDQRELLKLFDMSEDNETTVTHPNDICSSNEPNLIASNSLTCEPKNSNLNNVASNSFSISANYFLDDEDLGEVISHEKFAALKKLSDVDVIEVSSSAFVNKCEDTKLKKLENANGSYLTLNSSKKRKRKQNRVPLCDGSKKPRTVSVDDTSNLSSAKRKKNVVDCFEKTSNFKSKNFKRDSLKFYNNSESNKNPVSKTSKANQQSNCGIAYSGNFVNPTVESIVKKVNSKKNSKFCPTSITVLPQNSLIANQENSKKKKSK